MIFSLQVLPHAHNISCNIYLQKPPTLNAYNKIIRAKKICKSSFVSWSYNYMPNIKLIHQFCFFNSSFKNPAIWLAVSIFNHAQLKIYRSSFMFLEPLCACQKSSLFISFSWGISNPAIWLARSILTHNSRTRIFPDIGFRQAQS